MFAGNGALGSFNSDVLHAQPIDDESKHRLIEEIKNRAKGCIPAKNYPEAVALYTKAIEVCPDADASAKAILSANRSMCRLAMNLTDGAVEDAQTAIALNPEYIKGYYRLGMALTQAGSFSKARDAFGRGLSKKPDDKELRTQLEAVEQKIKEKKPGTVGSSSVRSPANISATTVAPASSTRSSVPPAPAFVNPSADEEEESGLNMRGYRKTADGKVTTFFNNELDEKTKALIGDIAPKKVEHVAAVEPINKGEGSAWNAAGTYEEKILTPWALDALKCKLAAIRALLCRDSLSAETRALLPDGVVSALIEAVAVEDVVGDAQVTLARGKKKHLCDMEATVKWRLTLFVDDSSTADAVEGEVKVADISADGDYEVADVVVTAVNGSKADRRSLTPSLTALFAELAQSTSKGLKPALAAALTEFCCDLKLK